VRIPPVYAQELKTFGLTHYNMYVSDGHAEYFGANNFKVEGKSAYKAKVVADKADVTALKHTISIHQQGQTTYLTFTDQAAEAGVEKWRTSMEKMLVVYYDKKGNEILVEPIPDSKGYSR
jgi:uncharacterized protein YbcV (DUF1398 family)